MSSNTVRPLYETAEDLARERSVIEYVASMWGLSFHKLPIHYGIDFLMQAEGMPDLWLEIKGRSEAHDRWPMQMLDAWKVLSAQRLVETFPASRAGFVFAYGDGALAYVPLMRVPRELHFSGRTDRGDAQDRSPCVRIPKANLRIIRDPQKDGTEVPSSCSA